MSSWHKGVLEWDEGGAVCLSVVFSWHQRDAYQRAAFHRAAGRRVRVGGPGLFRPAWAVERFRELGAECGGEIPDTVCRHNPAATIASRGCPVGCSFCIVPAMEGREFTLLPDFVPRPILCDNNLSDLPAEYQDHIVARYRAAGMRIQDANSGFEPHGLDEACFFRWKDVLAGPWRFAYDTGDEREAVRRACAMLRRFGVLNPRRIRVYVLIGNESPAACLERIREVIGWGGEPHVQAEIKLNAQAKEPWVRERLGWNRRLLTDMARWANRRLWRYTEFEGYARSARTARCSSAAPAGQLAL